MTTITPGELIPAATINQWAPTGVVVDYAGSTAPDGWFICDGSAISRTSYSDLFTAIGTTYGTGDGTTTFNLPDCRGRVGVGYAPSGGHTDVSTLGNNDGVSVADRRATHRHSPHSHGIPIQNDFSGSGSPTLRHDATGSSGTYMTPAVDGGSGNSSDSLDAPAYIVLNKIIRAKDV